MELQHLDVGSCNSSRWCSLLWVLRIELENRDDAVMHVFIVKIQKSIMQNIFENKLFLPQMSSAVEELESDMANMADVMAEKVLQRTQN